MFTIRMIVLDEFGATVHVVLALGTTFESFSGPVDIGFPCDIGKWGGNPAEVIEEADGNRMLRFQKTGDVRGGPDDLASNCSVFQLVDLSTLRRQWGMSDRETQVILNLSARFRREAAPTDSVLPRLGGSCRIYLFKADPEAIGKRWPRVIDEDGVGYGKKGIKLEPGEESTTITASCLLESDSCPHRRCCRPPLSCGSRRTGRLLRW
ncbi:MAG: hypothetical protein AAFU85_15100 [Planctomycetota bacterium]